MFFLFRSLFYGTYYFSIPLHLNLNLASPKKTFLNFMTSLSDVIPLLLSLKKYDNLYDRDVHVDIWAGENTVPVCGDYFSSWKMTLISSVLITQVTFIHVSVFTFYSYFVPVYSYKIPTCSESLTTSLYTRKMFNCNTGLRGCTLVNVYLADKLNSRNYNYWFVYWLIYQVD